MKIIPGLLSVTFRKLSPAEILLLVEQADIRAIEWGGDIHVPHGDTAKASEVKRMCGNSGVVVASYGSYYRVGSPGVNGVTFDRVLDSAISLGAPSIRVWAGAKGSNVADESDWSAVIDDAAVIASQAASAGITIDFEYHANTLTDSREAVKRLLEGLPQANIRSHWQRPVGMPLEESVTALREILPRLANLHVYHWVEGERRPLGDGLSDWQTLLQVIAENRDVIDRQGKADRTEQSGRTISLPQDKYALLEFVRDDSPEQFLQDAAVLKSLLREFA